MHLVSNPHPSGCVVTVDVSPGTSVVGQFVDNSTSDVTAWLADLALFGYLIAPNTTTLSGASEATVEGGSLVVLPDQNGVTTITGYVADPFEEKVRSLTTSELCQLAAAGATLILTSPPVA